MRLTLFLFLAIFITSTVTAQLYDNRSRYLKTPYDVDKYERNLNTFQKPTRRAYTRSTQSYNSRRSYSSYRNPQYYRTNSYNNYRSRVSRYTIPSYDSRGFYSRFRDPIVLNRYANNAIESEFELKDCHCNYRNDINQAYQQWYESQELARADLLRNYEALFEKKIEKLLNKQFPDFKSAQKEIYNGYVKIHDNFHYNKISPFVNKDYINKENLLEKNTAFYNVAKHNGNNSYYINALQREVVKSSNAFLISKELQNRLNIKKLPYHGYIVDKHIDHYNKQNNYEYKLGMFNAYLVYYQNGDKPLIARPTDKYSQYMYYAYNYDKNEVLDYMKNIIKRDVPLNGYYPKLSLAYSKAIVNFHNMTFPQRSITKYISAGRWGRIPIKVPVPGTPLKCQENNSIQNNPELEGIKQAILNKTPLKRAVFKYLENANDDKESQNTVLEAVGCRLKNAPFTWSSKFGHFKKFNFQTYENPSVVLSINLYSYLSNTDSAKAYYLRVGTDVFQKIKHKGIADVLKYIYDVEKYRSVEGGTIRHFLKKKGLNVPHSLSDRDLGKLFDFGGGNTNTLTIEFSDYAKKYITNFHHGDGKYGTSLFTDPFKLQALKEILDGNTVDFDARIINDLTGKAKCVYDRLENLSGGFKNMIKKFDGEFPVSHLKFEMTNDLSDDTNAVTSNSGKYTIAIKINSNTIEKRTLIGLSRTFAHEVIHAEIYRKIRSVGSKVSINDFPGIYDYYRRHKDWQHEQMAAHYIEVISDIVSEFDNNNHSRQFYEDIAWEGLHKTSSWNSLSSNERSRILKKIENLKNSGNKICK